MSGKALPALFCVPVLVKDNIDTVGMVTTAGSIALLDNFPQRDAQPVRRGFACPIVADLYKLHGMLSIPVWLQRVATGLDLANTHPDGKLSRVDKTDDFQAGQTSECLPPHVRECDTGAATASASVSASADIVTDINMQSTETTETV